MFSGGGVGVGSTVIMCLVAGGVGVGSTVIMCLVVEVWGLALQ